MQRILAARVVGAGVLVWATLGAAAQPQLVCGRDDTGRTWCIDYRSVGVDAADLRFASLYLGNERVAHPTSHVARANCQAQVIEFASAGRPFWSARFGQSALAGRLGAAMCE